MGKNSRRTCHNAGGAGLGAAPRHDLAAENRHKPLQPKTLPQSEGSWPDLVSMLIIDTSTMHQPLATQALTSTSPSWPSLSLLSSPLPLISQCVPRGTSGPLLVGVLPFLPLSHSLPGEFTPSGPQRLPLVSSCFPAF